MTSGWKTILRRLATWDLAALAVCMIPAVFVAAMFLQVPGEPVGGDPATHAVIIREMLRSDQAYARYSQFPAGGLEAEYPALFDLIVALIVAATQVDIFTAMNATVVALSFLSPLCYWRFFRVFFPGRPQEAFVATLIVSVSWFELMKTVRDGSYGELLGAGVLLPLWLSFLWEKRVLLAGTTLFALVLTHNLSALLALGIFIAYLITEAAQKNWMSAKRAIAGHALVLVAMTPFAWSVYLSYVAAIASGTGGGFAVLGFESYPDLLTPFLLAFGIIAAISLARHPRERFFSLWTASYFALAQSNFGSERIVRNLSFPLAACLAVFTMILVPRIRHSLPQARGALPAIVLSAIVVTATVNGLQQLATQSDPAIERYLQPHQLFAYEWLNSQPAPLGGILSIDAGDVYLPAFVASDVYGIYSQRWARTFSLPDRVLNEELRNALMTFNLSSSVQVFKAWGIRWIVLSTLPPPPVFVAPTERELILAAWALPLTDSPGYTLAHVQVSSVGVTRIIEIRWGGAP